MRVLVAEDDVTSRLILERLLPRWGYEVVSTRDGAEAWARLQDPEAPRLLVLDWMMPEMDGVEVCRRLRTRDSDMRYSYVIMLTAKGKKEDISEGMAAGADDYLIKPFEQSELQVRLRAGKRIIELQSELLQARRVLREHAMVDPVTGLYNRPAVLTRLAEEMSRAGRNGTPLSLALLELNIPGGGLAEDDPFWCGPVFSSCVNRVHGGIRLYDMLGHLGGDRLVLVLPGADANVAPAICERVRLAVCNPLEQEQTPSAEFLSLTASLGVVLWDGEETLEQWFVRAGVALDRAKSEGGNRVVADFSAAE